MIQQENKGSMLDANCLKDKVVLLTGATGGIGSEVAKALTCHGAETILVGRHKKSLEALYDELLDLGPEGALYVTDLLKLGIKEIEELRTHIDNLFGRLDGFIHCAGLWGTFTPIEQYPEKQWLEVIHLNLNVPFIMIKNLLPLLRKSQQGSIILTESDLSFETKAFHGAFNCAQYGQRAMIEMLQQELEHTSVQIKGFNPKAVDTKLRKKLFPADDKSLPSPQSIALFYVEMLA